MKNISFKGWDNCCELTAGDFKIIVTTDVGPRIIGGFLGDNPFNIFNVDEKLAGTSGAEKWVNYGGHRLWHSPETLARDSISNLMRIVRGSSQPAASKARHVR